SALAHLLACSATARDRPAPHRSPPVAELYRGQPWEGRLAELPARRMPSLCREYLAGAALGLRGTSSWLRAGRTDLPGRACCWRGRRTPSSPLAGNSRKTMASPAPHSSHHPGGVEVVGTAPWATCRHR